MFQDTQRAGELLVDSLMRLIRGESVHSEMVPAQLVVRQSA